MIEKHLPAQFINYRLVQQTNGDLDKVPVNIAGFEINAHAASNWLTYDQAVANANAASSLGVAFVLTDNDPWFFLDLDKCTTAQGEWTQEAQAIYQSFTGAFGEVSISGRGLHIMGKCRPGMLADRRRKWDGWKECYTSGRFIAFGKGWQPIGDVANPEIDWTDQLLHLVPQRTELGELTEGVDPEYTGPTDDDELIAKMLASTGGVGVAFQGKATVAQLWNADPIALGNAYPSMTGKPFDHSSADAALMQHLAFWTGKNMPRMERLFRRSGLMRPKFERKDYRTDTIQGAVRLCKKVYDYKKPEADKPATQTDHSVLMSLPEMLEHFKGCVYVRDQHKVLTHDGELLDPSQFKTYYGGHIFQMQPDWTGPEKNAFIAFTENRMHEFPKVQRSTFNPNLTPGEITTYATKAGRPYYQVNTYFPLDIKTTNEDVSPFLNHLAKLLPDARDREILLSYCAACVQYIGKKFQWAPVLQGAEGNGKTFIADFVAYTIGDIYTHRPRSEELAEKYNSYLEGNLFVIVEEIYMSEKIEILNTLKPYITNRMVEVRGMRENKRMVLNFTNWFFCTNFQNAVIKTKNDRRYGMFFTAQQSADDIIRDGMGDDYFPKLYAWAENGGYAAVANFLRNYQIRDEFNPATMCHRAPETSTTQLAIEKSAGNIETEILEAVEDGTIGFRDGFISMWALDRLLRNRNLRLAMNKRGSVLEAMGYIRCPGLKDGRMPFNLVWEEERRPVVYVRKDKIVGPDPAQEYIRAQGYLVQ